MASGFDMKRNGFMKSISMRVVLVAVLTAMVLVPLSIFWAWSSAVAFQRQVADVNDRHLLIARNLGAALHRYHRDVSSAFLILSHNVVLGQPLKGTEKLLKNLNFRHLCIADASSGRVVATAGPPSAPCPEVIPAKRFAMFQELAQSPELAFSGVMPNPNGEPTIYLVKRYDDRIAVGALTTGYFQELGKRISFGRKGHAAIVDQFGRVLAHPKPSWIEAMKDISKVPPVARMLAGEQGTSTFYSPALKADMIAGFTAINGTGWGVMIPQPVAELEEAASAANQSALMVLAVALAIAVLLGWILASHITGPLQAVMKAAHRMADGDTAARVKFNTRRLLPYELDELRSTFNRMAEAVQQAESEERAARLQADAANHTKTHFIANVSHELRTPLNAIIGFSQLMNDEPFGKVEEQKHREYLSDIHDSAKHLLRLINDLLDISSIEVGALTFQESPVRVPEMLDSAAKIMAPAAQSKEVDLTVRAESGRTVSVDEGRFGQILINLIGNAIRFTPAGGEVSLSAADRDDGSIEITVSDNGTGINPADLERVQDPFQRGGDPVTRNGTGTGLGLAIVKTLANWHQVDFRLESSPGDGTTAVLRLPPHRVINDPAAAA